jgi:CheY-like chemotaxis protein
MSSREPESIPDTVGEASSGSIEGQKRILVIDDDPVTVKALTMALTNKGYAVYSAHNGSQAISVVRAANPDMLMVDVHLSPDDAFGAAGTWDGFQVTRWLRNVTGKNIPAIIISANANPDYKKYADKIGAQAFMAKPLSCAALFESIESALSSPNRASSQ